MGLAAWNKTDWLIDICLVLFLRHSTSNRGLESFKVIEFENSTIPFDRSYTSSYSSSILTVAISCIVSEIKRDTGWKSADLFHTPLLRNNASSMGKTVPNVFLQPSQILGLACGISPLFTNSSSALQTNRVTDWQTDEKAISLAKRTAERLLMKYGRAIL